VKEKNLRFSIPNKLNEEGLQFWIPENKKAHYLEIWKNLTDIWYVVLKSFGFEKKGKMPFVIFAKNWLETKFKQLYINVAKIKISRSRTSISKGNLFFSLGKEKRSAKVKKARTKMTLKDLSNLSNCLYFMDKNVW